MRLTRFVSQEIAVHRTLSLLAVLPLLCLSGCQDIARPDWFSPGTARLQRTRAGDFDPYPDPHTGRDDGSARPRDYLNPPPEADRAIRSINPQTGTGYSPDRWQASGP